MYSSREYQLTSRFNQQYEKSTSRIIYLHIITNIYHPPKQQKYPERHFLDPPKTVTYQPEVSYPENIKVIFPEGQLDKQIETNSLHEEEAIEQEYIQPTEKHYINIFDLKQQIKYISSYQNKLI